MTSVLIKIFSLFRRSLKFPYYVSRCGKLPCIVCWDKISYAFLFFFLTLYTSFLGISKAQVIPDFIICS